jgi:hypothetical protein
MVYLVELKTDYRLPKIEFDVPSHIPPIDINNIILIENLNGEEDLWVSSGGIFWTNDGDTQQFIIDLDHEFDNIYDKKIKIETIQYLRENKLNLILDEIK